jgi:hypothetical protein
MLKTHKQLFSYHFLLTTGRWFSPGTPVSSTNKNDRHEITHMVTLNATEQQNQKQYFACDIRLVMIIAHIYF